jgi:hypothetical protein
VENRDDKKIKDTVGIEKKIRDCGSKTFIKEKGGLVKTSPPPLNWKNYLQIAEASIL